MYEDNNVRLKKEKILDFHNMLIERTGGDSGLRDEKLLDSALNAPFQTYRDEELYFGIYEQAAALGYYIINNHPFVDGNKRIGMFAMLTFMEINRERVTVSWEEVARVGWEIARGETSIAQIRVWLMVNSEMIRPKRDK